MSTPNALPWPPLTYEHQAELAHLVVHYVRWLHPDLVAQVVTLCTDPEWQAECTQGLQSAGIHPDLYLWPGSTCLYPGIRRPKNSLTDGTTEIRRGYKASGALRLSGDTNEHARRVWNQLVPQYAELRIHYHLVHLFPHQGLEVAKLLVDEPVPATTTEQQLLTDMKTIGLPGLFTSAANMCYLPGELTRPSDADSLLRQVLWHKALELYPTALLPPVLTPLAQKFALAPPLEKLDWAAPFVGLPLSSSKLNVIAKARRNDFRATLEAWRNRNTVLVPSLT